jgi:hypothetical protein
MFLFRRTAKKYDILLVFSKKLELFVLRLPSKVASQFELKKLGR